MSGKRLSVFIALAVAATVAAVAGASSAAGADASNTYLVLYKGTSVPADAATTIAGAGGTLVQSYDRIGVAVARSSSASFADQLGQDKRIEGVSSTAGLATQLTEEVEAAPAIAPAAPWGDPLSGLQWDMVQIHVPEAHAINGGSPSVLVGDIDTGLDYTHPDLAPNVDFAKSVSCVGGVPDQTPAAWFDLNGHGTHTAGTIAAARTASASSALPRT